MLAPGICTDRETLYRVRSIPFKKVETETSSEEQSLLRSVSQGNRTAFWQLWQQHQDYLYRRCRTWMGGNPVDAEEAFSRATLKAWDKLPDYAGKINNPKAWLTQMTHNLCVDIHRERQRGARSIENIEAMAVGEHEAVASSDYSPESAILRRELGMTIRRAINALPPRLQEPFSLRFYQEMSYTDIAQQLALSQDNVYKRIQQARAILQKQLNRYLSGLDSSAVKKPQFEEPTLSKSPVPTTTGCNVEQINYQVTATCLETLPHAWYNSPSLQGWS